MGPHDSLADSDAPVNWRRVVLLLLGSVALGCAASWLLAGLVGVLASLAS
jgi:hypothetical protein